MGSLSFPLRRLKKKPKVIPISVMLYRPLYAPLCMQGPAFVEAFEKYVKPFLRKGVPSLFADISSLYK